MIINSNITMIFLHYFENPTTPFSFRKKKITMYLFYNIKNWFSINGSKSHAFKLLYTNECFIKLLLYLKLVSSSHSMRGICAGKHNWGATWKINNIQLQKENLHIWFLTFIRWGRVNWKGEIINLAVWRARESSLCLTSGSHPEGN